MVILIVSGCSTQQGTSHNAETAQSAANLENSFTVPGQVLPPDIIRSLQFYRGNASEAPVLNLGTNQTLTLKFDEIANESSMFRVKITHHNADWSLSSLLPNLYLRGFHEDYIQDSEPGRFQTPLHFSYTYTFPNSSMGVTRSGNYMMEVYNQADNRILFSMPFFVFEREGRVITQIEELYNLDERTLRHHQLFAGYTYDDPSAIAQIDYQVKFVQNQFWGQARTADQQDFSESGLARFYLSRDYAFPGTFEFLKLDLQNLDQYSMQVVDIRQDITIPRVTLNRDIVNLRLSPSFQRLSPKNNPRSDRDARYALVRFQLDVPARERTSNPIYVVGGFNNFSIQQRNRMYFNTQTGYYTGEAIVKEGSYAYKYVTLDGRRVNDTYFDASFASTMQEYHTFVYRRDQTFQYDRLIEVERFFSD